MPKWLSISLTVLALILWAVMVWFVFPLIGFGESRPFEAVWVRIVMIAVVWLIVFVVWLIGFLKRRKAEKALETALTETEVTGDGEVLSEKMTEALDILKKSSGSKSYLYELPWYVIIGPPGSGKTTALLNSGLKFPLAEKGQGAVAGVGGTRYCDWWFSEEAVMIDTAGRYTTQDSDAEADKESWISFLKLLKTNRANQPINGIILAISLQEIMTGTETELEAHAEVIRRRLIELHEHLKVDFPVYVLFTKADLISGFMEYFGSFSQSRREKVWGHTFQTEDKKAQTVGEFGKHYDALVERLSEEVTDRLIEEPDGINRIAIFGFPGQVAMLKDRLTGFMNGVFGHSRYKVNATLRGFYFSSGTQEGTPIDQVLGAMERGGAGALMGAGMSGKAKSFFLHDLLKKVIFAESGWVSTDRKAVLRTKAIRYTGFGLVAVASLTMLGLWGWSFMQNRELVRTAQAAIADYEIAAQDELARTELASFELLEVVSYLDMLRNMPLGYADLGEDASVYERFGLSQRKRLESAAKTTYRQALERMMRSRMIVRLEQVLQGNIRNGETLAVYETLKVYKLLGNVAPKSDNKVIIGWFTDDWEQNLYQGPVNRPTREALLEHLDAMLELGATRNPSFELNGALIDQAERTLARMDVADQAYALILSGAAFAPIADIDIASRTGRDSELVLESKDGTDLSELRIDAIYTYSGFHDFFLPALSRVADDLLEDQWVLGDYAAEAQLEDQISTLGPILLQRYTDEWIDTWDAVLENLQIKSMASDKPAYRALAAASAARSSPLLRLTEMVVFETKLTEERGAEEGDSLAEAVEGGVAGAAGGAIADRVIDDFVTRQGGLTRIGLDVARDGAKSNRRAGAAGGGSTVTRLPGEDVEIHYSDWEEMIEGDPPTRLIDQLLAAMNDIQRSLILGVDFPDQAAAQMPAQLGAIKQAASRLPPDLARLVTDMIEEIEGDARGAALQSIREKLNTEVTQVCEAAIENSYPFSAESSRDMSISDFSKIFAPRGVIDRFFLEELSAFANVGPEGWEWKNTGPMAGKLSPTTLKQFERAAEIRDAFFDSGGGVPMVAMTITPVSIHNTIRRAILQVNGQVAESRRRGNVPINMIWPGSGGSRSVSLQFLPSMVNREGAIEIQGDWAFLRFLRAGSPKLSGSTAQVRFTIGGRHIVYTIELATPKNPFFLNELRNFKCPSGI